MEKRKKKNRVYSSISASFDYIKDSRNICYMGSHANSQYLSFSHLGFVCEFGGEERTLEGGK
jgi:hypothetical protein